jgi:hypothetical protein
MVTFIDAVSQQSPDRQLLDRTVVEFRRTSDIALERMRADLRQPAHPAGYANARVGGTPCLRPILAGRATTQTWNGDPLAAVLALDAASTG